MLLEARRLCYGYEGGGIFRKEARGRILDDISFYVKAGERVGLMGASGSGKSTLAKILAGFYRPQSGELLIEGAHIDLPSYLSLSRLSHKKRAAFYKSVQIIFQDPLGSLNPRLTLEENLALPMRHLLGLKTKKERLDRIEPLLKRLGLESSILQSYPGLISGGQAQRICLLRALCVKPKILILDEATSNLDYLLSLRILKFLMEWQGEEECCFIYITHDEEMASFFCQRILTLEARGDAGSKLVGL